MSESKTVSRVVRFGVFELDTENGELRKRGSKLKIEPKPLQILEMLLECPGEVVTRRRVREKLWPDTYVSFDYSLNTAINKLRAALGDSAHSPRFIETVARRGYRFILSVEGSGANFLATPRREPDEPSIAILPFENAGGEDEIESLCDELSEAVIRAVARIAEVPVMAWSTVLRYKGRQTDALAIGRELRARWALIGRVKRSEESLAIRTELADAETGWRLWAGDCEQSPRAIGAVAEEIAKQVAARLERPAVRRTEARDEAEPILAESTREYKS
jgi:TolB-like protein